MFRFVTGLCLGVSIAAFVAGLFVDVFVFPQAERDWGKLLPNLAGISIFAGLMVSFLFWEMAGHAKDSFSRVVKAAPSRRWFYWGAGAGLVNGALIAGTVTVVVTIARWIPFLEEWALAVILGTGLLSTLIYGILTQPVIQNRVLKQRAIEEGGHVPDLELDDPDEAPDFFESLRPRVAAAFVVLWSAPIFAAMIWWPDFFERILLVQVSLLAGAGIAVRLSRRVQRWIFRPGLLLEQVRQGYFAINLWIVLAALFAIFSVTNGRL